MMENHKCYDYEKAIVEMKRAYHFFEEGNNDIKSYPYFFIVGAGISSQVVKTAGAIIEDCKVICKEEDDELSEGQQNNQYSDWLQKAFPHKESRRKYLESLIVGQKIPEAAAKLASILKSGKVSNLVITPNFDKFILEALNIFGERNILIADRPESVTRLNINSNYINILHVHGTYEFYDLCNLTSEINKRASDNSVFSVKSFLRKSLSDMSPIVVGYSGWENDVIMTELRERLKSPLKYKMYWFCYNEKAYQDIPAWLKYTDSEKKILREDIVFILPKNHNKQHNDEGIDEDPTLDCTEVFSSIMQKFEIDLPEIVQNPISFLKKHYSDSFKESNYKDLLLLGLDSRSENMAVANLKTYIIHKNQDAILASISMMVDRISDYSEEDKHEILACLIILLEDYKINRITEEQLNEIINRYIDIYISLDKPNSKDIYGYCRAIILEQKLIDSESFEIDKIQSIYQLIVGIYEDYKKIDSYYDLLSTIYFMMLDNNMGSISLYDNIMSMLKGKEEKRYRTLYLHAHLLKINSFYKDERYDDAIKLCDAYFSDFDDNSDIFFKRNFILINNLKAYCLKRKSDFNSCLQIYEFLLEKYKNENDLQEMIIGVYGEYLEILHLCNKYEVVDDIFSEIVERYKNVRELQSQRLFIQICIRQGLKFEERKEYNKALEINRFIVQSFLEIKNDEIRNLLIEAYINEADCMYHLEMYDDAFKKYDEIIKGCRGKNDFNSKIHITKAILGKVDILDELEDYERQLIVLQDIVEMYQDSDSIDLKMLYLYGFNKLIDCLLNNNQLDQAMKVCQKVIKNYENLDDLDLQDNLIKIYLQQALIAKIVGNYDYSIEVYNKIIAKYNLEEDVKYRKIFTGVVRMKMEVLFYSKRYDEISSVYDSLINQYSEDENIENDLIEVKLIYADLLSGMGNDVEALELYSSIFEDNKDNEDLLVKIYTIDSLLHQDSSLFKLGKYKELLELYDFILLRYKDERDISIRRRLSTISGQRIYYLAKINELVKINELANIENIYADLIDTYTQEEDKEIRSNLANAIVNVAYLIRLGIISNFTSLDLAELFKKGIEEGLETAYINYALVLIDKGEYVDALELVDQVKEEDSFDWWLNLDDKYAQEKYRVIYLGLIKNKIVKSDYSLEVLENKLMHQGFNEFIENIKLVLERKEEIIEEV